MKEEIRFANFFDMKAAQAISADYGHRLFVT